MIGKAILWGVIGAIAGGCLGGLAGIVGSIIVGLGIGIAAFVSSYRNEGRPPKWLWRSKIKQDWAREEVIMETSMNPSANSEHKAQTPELADSQETIMLYNPNTAGLLSLLLSPVFGAIIIRSNWRALGNEAAAKRSLCRAVGLVIAFVIIVLFVPQKAASSTSMILLLGWYFMDCRSCQKHVRKHHPDYQKKSWKRPLVLGIPICILSLLILGVLSSGGIDEEALAESAKPIVNQIFASHQIDGQCKKITKIRSLGDGKYSAKAICDNDIVLNIEIEELDGDRIQVRILE